MKRSHLALAAVLLILWTVFLVFMFQRETALEEKRLRDIALSQARALFNQVVDVRDWNSRHGGVYVPVTPETPPNPWLDVPNRDETTLSGRRLTLMNPAYMTRQLAELTRQRRGIGMHLTSRNPLRPENGPRRPGSATALAAFERGEREQVEFARDAGGRETSATWRRCPWRSPASPATPSRGTGSARCAAASRSPTRRTCSPPPGGRSGATSCSRASSSGCSAPALIGAVTAAYHQKKLMVARLRELALVDELTGLHNRRGFLLLAEKQLQIARRTGRPDLLLFVDLDGMKRINDEFGHEAGDAALRRTAAVLHAAFRTSDIIARLGGDEFVVLCPNTGPEAAADAAGGARAARRGRQRRGRRALAALAERGVGGVRPAAPRHARRTDPRGGRRDVRGQAEQAGGRPADGARPRARPTSGAARAGRARAC